MRKSFAWLLAAILILVHAKSQEEAFVEAGYSYVLDGFASERLSFLYNYFVLCGPSDDPAGVAGMGVCLIMAEEMHAYILTDKATFPIITRRSRLFLMLPSSRTSSGNDMPSP